MVARNPALKSITGFENITSVGGNLSILDNDALSDINFDQLCSVGGEEFTIKSNPKLCNNLATDLKNQVEVCPGGGFVFDPDILINGNKDCSLR